ncbi:MAG TPA: hypothetical protein VGQ20_07065 [Acidimicrobiales bacterium]|jgi:hypothetical protein|nr:hypothetical protein [Acidimicrobiales bacterium]
MLTTTALRQRGSVLMLMPAAVLVMLVLGSIAVDFAFVGLRERELRNAAAGAANDAATAGLSRVALREGDTTLDPDEVERVVDAALAATDLHLAAPPVVEIGPDGRTVTVFLAATYEYVFAKALPGAPDHFTVRSRATARSVVADEG